jgi:ParB family chromosome partitioning protein
MAEHLKISKSWLSRLLDVARLPSEIVAAFPDTHGITVRVARDIKPLTSDRRALDLMIAESRAIVAERDDLGSALSAPEIAKRLIRATVAPVKSSNSDAEVRGANGKVILRYAHSARGGHTFKVPARSGASTTEVLKAIESVLQKG